MKRLLVILCLIPQLALAADIERALTVVFGREGGLQCDKNDPGNWTGGKVGVGKAGCTKYGIATNTYPKEDIKNLTLERAGKLYERDFWKPLNLDRLRSQGLATEVFDTAVNCGVGTSAKIVNKAVSEVKKIVKLPDAAKPVITNETQLNKETVDWINDFTKTSFYTSITETTITLEECAKAKVDGFIEIATFKDGNIEHTKETCIEDRSNRLLFWYVLNNLQAKRYITIVQKNPKMRHYFLSWINRTVE